jgi:hypothetical protein
MRAIEHRMSIGEAELGALIEMALKAGLRRSAGVYDRAMRAAGLIVQACRPVAGFAAYIFGMVARSLHARVSSSRKPLGDLLMALGAGFRTHEGSAGNCRGREQSSVSRAREQRNKDADGSEREQHSFPTPGSP